MSTRTILIDDELSEYIKDIAIIGESDVLAELREETGNLPMGGMQISVEQGRLMALFAKLLPAKKAIEIGVFTGYSSICVASAMPDDGKLIACDVSEEWTSIAKKYWKKAGVEDKIELHIAPAIKTLKKLMAKGGKGTFDFAFIDADKESTPEYFELCLELLRPGGLIGIDNAFMGGRVVSDDPDTGEPRVMRQITESLSDDDHIDTVLVPIGDGLFLARKK
jgi:predicted O-methyltransferase YrrM